MKMIAHVLMLVKRRQEKALDCHPLCCYEPMNPSYVGLIAPHNLLLSKLQIFMLLSSIFKTPLGEKGFESSLQAISRILCPLHSSGNAK